MDFIDVWQDIIKVINNNNTIFTLSQRRKNIITDVIPEGLMVVTSGEFKLVKKEWIEATWNALQNTRKITASDIPGTARYRSSFIMALLSQLEYVRAEDNPNTLYLNIPKE